VENVDRAVPEKPPIHSASGDLREEKSTFVPEQRGGAFPMTRYWEDAESFVGDEGSQHTGVLKEILGGGEDRRHSSARGGGERSYEIPPYRE